MADVDQRVADIRQAVYGEQVREALASGIEVINNEVTSTTEKQKALEIKFDNLIINAGTSNAEIVAARGVEATLQARLNASDALQAQIPQQTYITDKAKTVDVNTSLALKANQADVDLKADKTLVDTNYSALDTKIDSQASGSPKATYATLSALQTAFPTGNTNIYVVTADGKWYYWAGSAWVVGGVYQSTGIGDLSVTPKKTNFVETKPLSVNLFDKTTVLTGYILKNGIDGMTAEATTTVSDYIKVTPNTTYAVSEGSYTHEFDVNKQFITGHGLGIKSFVVGATTEFIRTTVRVVRLNDFMLIEGTNIETINNGSTPVNYIPYKKGLFMADLIITPPNTSYKYSGKTWNVLGDSITEVDFAYWSILKDQLGFSTVNNYGVGGTSITPRDAPWDTNAMSIRYVDMADNADLITVLGGTNDNGVVFGTMADRDTTTFYGSLHVLYSGLVNKYPTKTIAVFTLTPRQSIQTAPTHSQKVDIIKEVCAYYSIPCLDLWYSSQLRPYNAINKTAFMPDGLHPNAEGYKLLASQMLPFLESL